tara:strand:- start:7097 stop:8350 length:1254 start_codon:yes stop_codon:yes gene_type:complete
MSTPNGGLITETNAQYYAGTQVIMAKDTTDINGDIVSQTVFTSTFDTDLTFGSNDPNDPLYNNNNFRLYTSANGATGTFTEYTDPYTVSNNKITTTAGIANNTYVVIQLLIKSGGNFGNKDAFGNVVEENYGEYQYIKINEVVNNFLVAYVGAGKLISSVKRTDVIFHAKRALQEFSYDTLKSIYSQELTIPDNLSVPLPHNYVNYVNVSWIDSLGVKHIIYPTTLTSNPYTKPIQDAEGIPTQDNEGRNITGTSITEERWVERNTEILKEIREDITGRLIADGLWSVYNGGLLGYGQIYGQQPEIAQINGWFTINEREGKMSFSSDLKDKLIILEYISDGLSYEEDMKVPKLAEEAMYAYIIHAILATRINQPEYVIQRLRREKSAKLRNAKIRLSNIKSNEFVQIMRGKSKWLKF